MESRPFLFVNRLELGDGFGRIARTETHLSRCRPLKNPSSVASAALKNLSVEHVLFTKRLNHVCGQTPSLSYEIETQSLAGLQTVQIADKELKGSSFVCLCLQQNPQRGNYPARVFLRLHTFANGETQNESSHNRYRSCSWWYSARFHRVRCCRCICRAVSSRSEHQGASSSLIISTPRGTSPWGCSLSARRH